MIKEVIKAFFVGMSTAIGKLIVGIISSAAICTLLAIFWKIIIAFILNNYLLIIICILSLIIFVIAIIAIVKKIDKPIWYLRRNSSKLDNDWNFLFWFPINKLVSCNLSASNIQARLKINDSEVVDDLLHSNILQTYSTNNGYFNIDKDVYKYLKLKINNHRKSIEKYGDPDLVTWIYCCMYNIDHKELTKK